MRILLITDGTWPFVMGGMQKHSYYLGKFLSQKGARVHLVHCAVGLARGEEWEDPAFSGLDERLLTFQNVPFPLAGHLPGHYIRESKRYSADVYSAVRSRLGEFDLVYCQGFTAWAFVEAKKRGEFRIPVVSNLHGYEMFQRSPSLRSTMGRGPLQRIARLVSLGSDAVFSFGGHITRILLEMGVRNENILECPIGIEQRWLVEEISRTHGAERVFVFVGRDERRKGIKELHEALKAMNREGDTGYRFHFIGPIAEKHRLLAWNVTYHGALSEEGRIQEILRDSDVLICASYAEGMPTVIMEAMASGLAIIATDVGAVSQQVDDNGWLLKEPSVVAIKGALVQAMRIPEDDIFGMKTRSLKKVQERFTWERVIERKMDLLKGLLQVGA